MDRSDNSLSASKAYELMRAAIVESEFAPGERIVEQRLAKRFGFSRTPVREAIRRLETEGLVVTEPNRGAIVREMTAQEVVDLYGLRIRLESYAAELAAQRMSSRQLTQLDDAVAAFSAEAARYQRDDLDGTRRLNQHNRALHNIILEGADHRRLHAMLARTVDVPLVFQAFRSFGQTELARSDQFHHLIAEAIRARRPDRAGRLMAEHIEQGLDVVMEQMLASGTIDNSTDLTSSARNTTDVAR